MPQPIVQHKRMNIFPFVVCKTSDSITPIARPIRNCIITLFIYKECTMMLWWRLAIRVQSFDSSIEWYYTDDFNIVCRSKVALKHKAETCKLHKEHAGALTFLALFLDCFGLLACGRVALLQSQRSGSHVRFRVTFRPGSLHISARICYNKIKYFNLLKYVGKYNFLIELYTPLWKHNSRNSLLDLN